MNIQQIKQILCIGVSSLVAMNFASAIILQENFSGNEVDTSKWNEDGFGVNAGEVTVSNGELSMMRAGSGHHYAIISKDDTFDFSQNRIEVDVSIKSFDRPNEGDGTTFTSGNHSHLWFSLGQTTSAANARSQGDTGGFSFAVTHRNSGSQPLYISNSIGNYQNSNISNVPTGISFWIDDTSYSITLQGATFIDEASNFTGTSTMTGTHSLGPYSAYSFLAGIESRGHVEETTAVLSQITVIPEPSTYAAIAGLFAFTFLLYRRRKN